VKKLQAENALLEGLLRNLESDRKCADESKESEQKRFWHLYFPSQTIPDCIG
jgi:hypothetical protein